MIRSCSGVLAGAVVACLFSSSVLAGTVAGGTELQVTSGPSLWGAVGSTYSKGGLTINTSWAGAWNTKVVAGVTYSPNYDLGDTFVGFCTDFGNTMSPNVPGGWAGDDSYTYIANPFSAATQNGNDGQAISTPPDPDWVDGNAGFKAAYLYNQHIGSVSGANANKNAAALAVAIWEVLYDTTYNLANGTFKATSLSSLGTEVLGIASGWISSAGDFGAANGWDYMWTWWAEQEPSSPGSDVQSLLGPPVPEPAEVALLIAAVFGIGVGYRRLQNLRAQTA